MPVPFLLLRGPVSPHVHPVKSCIWAHKFLQIPDELWNPPPWVNETKAIVLMIQMENDGIMKSCMLG